MSEMTGGSDIQVEQQTLEKVDRRLRHGEDVREKAYQLFSAGKGYKYVSRVLEIPKYTVRDWKRLFALGCFVPSRKESLEKKKQFRMKADHKIN